MRLAFPNLLSWLEKGAVIVLPTRLEAAIADEQVTRHSLQQGLDSWPRSTIYHVDAWMAQCWQEVRYKSPEAGTLLSPAQEQALWQSIIEQQQPHLFDARATAQLARRAARLISEWDIAVGSDSWSEHEDAQQFQRWHSLFRRKCRDNAWTTRADLWRLLPNWIAAGLCSRELTVFAGFRTLPPALQSVLQAFGLFAAVESGETRSISQQIVAVHCRDTCEEIERGARWARVMLERNAAWSIGVFVPDLATQLALVERTFERVFYPSSARFERARIDRADFAFHLASSAPLREHPLVSSALLLLELARPRLAVADAGAILRCAFITGAAVERNARAIADVELRRSRDLDVSLRDIEFAARSCTLLEPVWRQVRAVLTKSKRHDELASWSELFSRLLQAAGWPGEAELSQQEEDVIEAWNDALSSLASLGLVSERISYDAALDRLRGLLGRPGAGAGSWSSPVQILDSLDAGSVSFDHACVTGVSEESWPPPLDAYPLVPLKLQRACEVPSSSPNAARHERERMTAALFSVAAHVVATYSGRLSPLAERFVIPQESLEQWQGLLPRASYASVVLDEIDDTMAPPYRATEPARGGTAIIKAQSLCPFRAFAEFRLNATRPEDACFGFDARDRGGFLHKALQYVWDRLRTQDRLRATPIAELEDVVREAILQAVEEDRSSPFHQLITVAERARLQEVILDWLFEIERERKQPFTVETLEQKRSFQVAGLPLSLRVDRMDRLRNGKTLLIDYKSGKQSRNKLEYPRPAEPQLWVYAASVGSDVDGVFFGEMRARNVRAVGISREKHFPGSSVTVKGAGWPEYLSDSVNEVERIAQGFVDGYAAVDPIQGACEYCNVKPFCRINEKPRQEMEAE